MGEVRFFLARKVIGVAGNSVDMNTVLRSVGLDVDGPSDSKLGLWRV